MFFIFFLNLNKKHLIIPSKNFNKTFWVFPRKRKKVIALLSIGQIRYENIVIKGSTNARSKAIAQRYSVNRVLLQIWQNSQENTCVGKHL